MSNSPKTEAGNRQVPIPPQILPFIMEQLEVSMSFENNNEDKLLFKPQNATINRYVDRENVNNTLKNVLKRNFGIKGITTHSLRHTYGTRCIEAGMQPTVVQKNMGHTDVSVTLNVYADVFDEFKQKEQEKFNEYFMKNANIFNQMSEKLITQDKEKNEDEELEMY
jgi:integrase